MCHCIRVVRSPIQKARKETKGNEKSKNSEEKRKKTFYVHFYVKCVFVWLIIFYNQNVCFPPWPSFEWIHFEKELMEDEATSEVS